MTRPAAKKSLGQHFLYNPATADHILDLAKITGDDRVLEIGPGPGLMTHRLAARAKTLVAVEKDHRFAAALKEKGITAVEADFLEVDLAALLKPFPGDRPWKVVANLPYNVATEILFRLLDVHELFESFHVMLQREVADRICAAPGSKTYGVLSVMTQLFSENKIVMKLKPGAFSPPPKVDSAVVRFALRPQCRFDIRDLGVFRSLVRAAFGQRRKTIANSLKNGGFPVEKILEALKTCGISPQARAETIPIDGFARLANLMT